HIPGLSRPDLTEQLQALEERNSQYTPVRKVIGSQHLSFDIPSATAECRSFLILTLVRTRRIACAPHQRKMYRLHNIHPICQAVSMPFTTDTTLLVPVRSRRCQIKENSIARELQGCIQLQIPNQCVSRQWKTWIFYLQKSM